MKTRHFPGWSLGLTLSVLPFVAGCNQQTDTASNELTNTISPQPAVQSAVAADTSTPVTEELKPIPAPPKEKTIPSNIRPTVSLSEILRLADAGVEENVMLAYVNSSPGVFNLGSDEIIYLTDIGVPDEVVTAMIERDQHLKQSWATSAQVAAATEAAVTNEQATESNEQPVAAAPTYVNQPETYPVEQPPQVVNYNYFYDNLAPYGSWVQLDNYGWCWQPTAVVLNPGWQPYCDRGRWLYTDCGWYWQSDYSWGLTFHYGRWYNHPSRGWCWVPDSVWGPAWVTWRYNDNYCGWAPLPPRCNFTWGVGLTYGGVSVTAGYAFGLSSSCYTFVPWRSVCDPRPYRHRLPPSQTRVAYHNSTVINNFGRGHNRTVINRGIAPERVGEISRTPVRRVALRDAQRRTGTAEAFYRTDLERRANGRSNAAAESGNLQSQTTATVSRQPGGRTDASLTAGRGNISAANRLSYTRDQRQSDSSVGIVDRSDTTQTARSQPDSRGTRSLIANGQDTASRQAAPQNAPPGSLIVVGNRATARARTQDQLVQPAASKPQTSLAEENISSPSVASRNNQPAVQTAPPQKASSSSLVIIGRPNTAQRRGQIYVVQPPARNNSQQDQSVSAAPTSRAEEIVASAPQAEIQRPDTSRLNQRSESPVDNSPTPSTVVNRSTTTAVPSYTPPVRATPSYTPRAPVVPSYTPPVRPTPTYTPRATATPSYTPRPVTPPAVSRPAPQQIRQAPVPRQAPASVAPSAPVVRSAPSRGAQNQPTPRSSPSSDNSSSRDNSGGGRRR